MRYCLDLVPRNLYILVYSPTVVQLLAVTRNYKRYLLHLCCMDIRIVRNILFEKQHMNPNSRVIHHMCCYSKSCLESNRIAEDG